MAQEIDGFTIDLNRITRREFRDFLARLNEVKANTPESDELSGEIVAKIIVAWPFTKPINKDNYINLGLEDGKRCDDAVTQALGTLTQKK